MPYVETEIAVQTRPVQTAIAQGWVLYRCDDLARQGRIGNQRHHQTSRPVFEIAVEASALKRRGAQHAIDIAGVAQGQQALDLALIHRPVFQVEPDAVIAVVGCIAHEERQIVPEATNAGTPPRAHFVQDFALSHIPRFAGELGCAAVLQAALIRASILLGDSPVKRFDDREHSCPRGPCNIDALAKQTGD